MRAIKPLLIAGAALAALTGAAAVAASGPQAHVLVVRLPNGDVEQIRYFGDTPPKVIFRTGPAATALMGPVALFGPNSAFAQMDRQMAAMMAQAHAVQAGAMLSVGGAGGLQQAAIGHVPAGGESFSSVSTFSGGHACTKSVQVIGQGAGKPPQVITKTTGDCGAPAVASPHGPVAGARTMAPQNTPHPIAVKAEPKPPRAAGGTTI